MYTRFTMPFGKHKGLHFDQIPETYFDWLLEQDWLSDRLREEIRDYFSEGGADRSYSYFNNSNNGTHYSSNQWGSSGHSQTQNPITPKLNKEEMSDFKKILNMGFRALAMKYHPDTGGTKEAMQRLNALVEKLRAAGLL